MPGYKPDTCRKSGFGAAENIVQEYWIQATAQTGSYGDIVGGVRNERGRNVPAMTIPIANDLRARK